MEGKEMKKIHAAELFGFLTQKVVVAHFDGEIFSVTTDEGIKGSSTCWGTREQWEREGFPMEKVLGVCFPGHSSEEGSFTYCKGDRQDFFRCANIMSHGRGRRPQQKAEMARKAKRMMTREEFCGAK